MRIRIRHMLLVAALLTGALLSTAIGPVNADGPAEAPTPSPTQCPDGTNWDNRLQKCVPN